MATRAEQARLFNEAIAQGLSEDQALRVAGIADPNEITYDFNTGKAVPAPLGPPARPNEVIVPLGSIRDDDDRVFSGPGTTTTSQTTVTGGAVTTTRVTPTTYRDTEASQALSSEAATLQAQKEARSAELRAQGKTGAEILRDPEYRALSQQQQAKQNAAQDARAVDQAGDIAVTTTPGTSGDVAQQTPNTRYLTNDTSGDDPTANLQEIAVDGDASAVVTVDASEDVDPAVDPQANRFVFDENGELVPADSAEAQRILAEEAGAVTDDPTVEVADVGFVPSAEQQAREQEAAEAQAAARLRAQAQATFQKWRKQANDGDWRVRLRLAPNATYLYKAPSPGILQPLAITDGVVFPYTPRITTAYRAEYSDYKLTHSNYRGFFYQNSYVEDLQIEATFTAQDTSEAEYLLAVIHFFRSATKMFYGANDPLAGSPPPLVYLQGLGEYQFNLHPCVVSQFNYNLPNDVDYIRARSKNISSNTALQYLNRRQRQDLPTNPFSSAWSRIENVLKPQGVSKGAVPERPAPPTLGVGDNLDNNPTYVPTKIDVTVILHPIQSRQQVSREFNMQNFANGNLLRGGFW
jgi:hypothetical protein